MLTFKQFNEHIIKVDNGYKLVSKKTGKNLGTSPTLGGIKKREAQVQYFKHLNSSYIDGMEGDGGLLQGSVIRRSPVNEDDQTPEDKGVYTWFTLSPASTDALSDWLAVNQIKNPVDRDSFHVTVVYSEKTIMYSPYISPVIIDPSTYKFDMLNGCLVLRFESKTLLDQWKRAKASGAVNKYPTFLPHITLSYHPNSRQDIDSLKPPEFPIMLEQEHIRYDTGPSIYK